MKKCVKGIPNLTRYRLNKIKAAIKKLKEYDELESLSRDIMGCSAFVSAMKDMGFKLQTKHDRTIFVNKELKLVVKAPLVCGWQPLRAAPTVIITEMSWKIFIQPLVDTSRKAISKAKRVMHRIENYDLDHFGDDAHYGNIGMYRNKAVIFDW